MNNNTPANASRLPAEVVALLAAREVQAAARETVDYLDADPDSTEAERAAAADAYADARRARIDAERVAEAVYRR